MLYKRKIVYVLIFPGLVFFSTCPSSYSIISTILRSRIPEGQNVLLQIQDMQSPKEKRTLVWQDKIRQADGDGSAELRDDSHRPPAMLLYV